MILFLWLVLQEGIAAEEYAARREALMEKLSDGILILDTGPLGNSPGVYDFKYLTNYHEDSGILVLLPEEKRPILFAKDTKKAATQSGIKEVIAPEEFESWAARVLAGKKAYTKLLQKNLDVVKKSAGSVEGRTLGAELTRLRLIKSKREQELTRKSSEVSAKAHVRTMKSLLKLKNESEVQKIYEEDFAKAGATYGYWYICGSGMNGTILHYGKNNQPLPKDSLIVCDCGTSYQGYVADVTRTFPTSGKFTKEQREKYQLVRDAQKAAEAVCKPGATLRELHNAAGKVFADSGHTKWAFSHSKDRTVAHGLGHFVGLYVHDSGSYDTRFEPGMVITIEPGWYDKDQGWGIRIEDMYLITADGFEHLSKDAPREIEEIEKAMGGD